MSAETDLGRTALAALFDLQESIEGGEYRFMHEAVENVIVVIQTLVTRLEEIEQGGAA
jgi:hypothetical protein